MAEQTDYPYFVHDLVYENDSLFIYGSQGIYTYNHPNIKKIKNESMSGASMESRDNGFTHLWGQISYHYNGVRYPQQLPNETAVRDLFYMDYKDNRVAMINSNFNIITGVRK